MRYLVGRKALAYLFVVLCVLALQSTATALPLVDLNADNLAIGPITSWANTGTLGGSFTNDTTSPTIANMGGKRCIYFDGADRMKSSFNAPAGITGNGDHSVAVWVYNPAIGTDESLVSWAKAGTNAKEARFMYGTSSTAGAVTYYGTAYSMGFAGGAPSAGNWHHLCFTFSGTQCKVYVDGVLNGTKNMTVSITANLPIYLGVGLDSRSRFVKYLSGYVRSVQVYDTALTQTEITNLVGRDAEVYLSNEIYYADASSTVNVRKSQHFRIVWGKSDPSGLMNEAYVQGNLYQLEQCWNRYHIYQGFHEPHISVDPAYQDGNKYKTNFYVNNTGLDRFVGDLGAFMGGDEHGFGYFSEPPSYMRWDPPSGATYHEYAHVCEMHAGGFNNSPSGVWWECFADWMELQFEIESVHYPDGAWLINQTSWLYQGHGEHYYDNWQIFEYLKEQPQYGYPWINTLWTQGNSEYIFDAMARLDPSSNPDKDDQVKDNFNSMAAHNVNWDYVWGQTFREDDTNQDKWRKGRCELVAKPASTAVWRVPWEFAPQQMGYNIIPLKMPGKTGSAWTVTANLSGWSNPARGTDCFRATLVAVSDTGVSRYSSQWHTGSNSITLASNENLCYLVVSGTPDFMPVAAGDDYRALNKEVFPYEVTLTNAVPQEYAWAEPAVTHHHHSNGGGFVADTATVDSTAYVGPNAQVLDSAQVRGSARVEDYARVQNAAQVRDNAIVSGHAWIQDSAQVYGYAKVRDYGCVRESAKVYGNAKVIEHATALGTMDIYENAVLRGSTVCWDGSGNDTGYVRGYSIWDGDACDGVNTDHGVFFGWLSGQDYANGRPDSGGIYCAFNFETSHAVWIFDTYGVVHGLPFGGPTIVTDADINRNKVLSLNGSSQYVELKKDVCDIKDTTIMGWIYWTGTANDQRYFSLGNGSNKYMYLTPKDATTSKLRFVISNGTTTQYLDGTAAIPASTWTHVAVVLSGTSGKLYVGGSPVATGTISIDPDQLLAANVNTSPACNYLGKGNAGNYFQGRIDDFRIYTKPLSDAEVLAIASKTIRIVPQMASLLFACDTDEFPASGLTGAWPAFAPTGVTLAAMGSPTVEILNTKKWDLNLYDDGDGYDMGSFASPIPCNGASIVVAVKPVRNTTSTPWTSIVDAFYNNLVLGIHNDTGEICVYRNGVLNNTGVIIPNGQMTVLSLVVQPTGAYRVFANGTQVVNDTTTSTFTQLAPGVEWYMHNINVGRNYPDQWTTFNGDIGDTFFYKIALTDVDRQTLESQIRTKFGF